MDVPQPEQVDRVIVMGDTVDAGEEERVNGRGCERRTPERRHRHRAAVELAERERVAEHARIRNPPMQVDEPRHPSTAVFHVVTLRRERLRLRLGRMVPAARGEHPVGAIEVLTIDQQVNIGSRSKVGRGIDRMREGRALEDQHVDLRVPERIQQTPGLVLATGVEHGGNLLLAPERGGDRRDPRRRQAGAMRRAPDARDDAVRRPAPRR